MDHIDTDILVSPNCAEHQENFIIVAYSRFLAQFCLCLVPWLQNSLSLHHLFAATRLQMLGKYQTFAYALNSHSITCDFWLTAMTWTDRFKGVWRVYLRMHTESEWHCECVQCLTKNIFLKQDFVLSESSKPAVVFNYWCLQFCFMWFAG